MGFSGRSNCLQQMVPGIGPIDFPYFQATPSPNQQLQLLCICILQLHLQSLSKLPTDFPVPSAATLTVLKQQIVAGIRPMVRSIAANSSLQKNTE